MERNARALAHLGDGNARSSHSSATFDVLVIGAFVFLDGVGVGVALGFELGSPSASRAAPRSGWLGAAAVAVVSTVAFCTILITISSMILKVIFLRFSTSLNFLGLIFLVMPLVFALFGLLPALERRRALGHRSSWLRGNRWRRRVPTFVITPSAVAAALAIPLRAIVLKDERLLQWSDLASVEMLVGSG